MSGAIVSLKFMDFITPTAALCGQMVNFKTLSDAAGIGQVTVKNRLGILERLGIVFYLHPYSDHMLKRMVTKPKLYLRLWFRGISDQMALRPPQVVKKRKPANSNNCGLSPTAEAVGFEPFINLALFWDL